MISRPLPHTQLVGGSNTPETRVRFPLGGSQNVLRILVIRVHPVMGPSLATNPALHLPIKDIQFLCLAGVKAEFIDFIMGFSPWVGSIL